MSFRTYLAVSFAGIIIILVVFMSIIINQKLKHDLTAEIGGSLAAAAVQMADKLDQYMWFRYNEVLLFSQLDALRESDVEEAQRLINQLNENIPSFSWVGLTDAEGAVLASTGGILKGSSIAQRPVFLEALNGDFIGDVHDAMHQITFYTP